MSAQHHSSASKTREFLMPHPHIHDNFVYAVSIHLDHRVLVLHTQYRDDAGPHDFTDACFSGVIGHYFQDVAAPSILLDIETVSTDWVVGQWREVFERGKNHGWPPLNHRNLNELCHLLNEQHFVGYRVLGSCGLVGLTGLSWPSE
jgi:hypothetical protein